MQIYVQKSVASSAVSMVAVKVYGPASVLKIFEAYFDGLLQICCLHFSSIWVTSG